MLIVKDLGKVASDEISSNMIGNCFWEKRKKIFSLRNPSKFPTKGGGKNNLM